jgi:aminopeptidase
MAAMNYRPPQKILEKYADVLVNFALNDGRGIKKNEVVEIVAHESAKPLYSELRKAVLRAGGHVISKYLPDNEPTLNLSRDFYQLANTQQLRFFPKQYLRGLIDQLDHSVVILSETFKLALEGVDPRKIMTTTQAIKPYRDWMDTKENQGRYTWTIALYGTQEMANHAGLPLKAYWEQIIKGCFLHTKDPIEKWKRVYKQIDYYRERLNRLAIDKLHVKGKDADVWLSLGEKRRWQAGSGRNIPSFEIFTTPDWRGTQGWIRFNQPLYRNEQLITGIELTFRNGRVVKGRAERNERYLKEMMKVPGADKVGEFSLTDARFSRITQFMAETLYDENIGGKEGNTHLALGKGFHDCYLGNPNQVSQKQWERLGFNDSAVHTDIISTARRTVTAYLKDSTAKVIYQNGQFTL